MKPWLLSLLGGGSLMLFSAYQDRVQRQMAEGADPVPAVSSNASVTQNAALQPQGTKPSVPLYLYEEDEESEDDDDEDDDDGSPRRVPVSQPATSAPAPLAPQPATTGPAGVAAGAYRDGSYRANALTEWGSMAIEVTVRNGKWTDIALLSVPDSSPSRFAVTYLVQQALSTQSDAIDGVTGATYTSDAFRDDLRQIITLSKT